MANVLPSLPSLARINDAREHTTVVPVVEEEVVVYDLCPPSPLPTLDLSLSIKSRFLSRRALSKLNAVVRRRTAIGIAATLGIVCYFLAVLLPARVGRALALLSAVLYIPNVLAAFSLLRFDVVRLLPCTYDFWFSSFINTSTFVVLVLIMGDVRGFAIAAAGLGIQNNILIDASVRAVKLWVVFNVFGTLSFAVTWLAVALEMIDEMEHHALVRFRSHELSAKGYATAGLVTITALVARNVYRKRHMFRTHSNARIIECVMYRTDLQYVVRHARAENARTRHAPASSANNETDPEYVKAMRYVPQVAAVDARDTLLRLAWVQQTTLKPSLRIAVLFHWFGFASAAVTGISSAATMYAFGGHSTIDTSTSGPVALVLTTLYCGTFALHLQRTVLKALCTSFDFVFLSVQVSLVLASLCDFLDWSRACCDVAAWWIWIHWVLTLDAATPVMRAKLGLAHKHFPVALVVVLVAVSLLLLWKLLVSDTMNPMYDRVLWRAEVFGHTLAMELAPLFFNCLGTVNLLTIRLLWRLVHNDVSVLLVLNGAVVYENYLLGAKCKRSRRMGSIVPSKPAAVQQLREAMFESSTPVRPVTPVDS